MSTDKSEFNKAAVKANERSHLKKRDAIVDLCVEWHNSNDDWKNKQSEKMFWLGKTPLKQNRTNWCVHYDDQCKNNEFDCPITVRFVEYVMSHPNEFNFGFQLCICILKRPRLVSVSIKKSIMPEFLEKQKKSCDSKDLKNLKDPKNTTSLKDLASLNGSKSPDDSKDLKENDSTDANDSNKKNLEFMNNLNNSDDKLKLEPMVHQNETSPKKVLDNPDSFNSNKVNSPKSPKKLLDVKTELKTNTLADATDSKLDQNSKNVDEVPKKNKSEDSKDFEWIFHKLDKLKTNKSDKSKDSDDSTNESDESTESARLAELKLKEKRAKKAASMRERRKLATQEEKDKDNARRAKKRKANKEGTAVDARKKQKK